MLLRILHSLGLTNLSDEQVKKFEKVQEERDKAKKAQEKETEREETPRFLDQDFSPSWRCWAWPWCVEVAYKDGYVAVRNSADTTKTIVIFTRDEWRIFVQGVKDGQFDF